MPKSKEVLPGKKLVSRRIKFKIGTRDSVKSALNMSNAELREFVAGNARGRDKQTARQVLDIRGISLTTPDKDFTTQSRSA